MKPVSCIVAPEFRRDPRDWEPEARRKFSVVAEKFPRHVLVVDDEPLIRWSVAESLSDRGLDVEQAADAASALRIVSNSALPFDVVVLDLRLPDMDDLSLLGTLRQLMPAASIILMTAFGTPELVAEAQAMGASVLNKPFELGALNRLVLGADANVA
jgi:DNA-binding NtrC family response regulator